MCIVYLFSVIIGLLFVGYGLFRLLAPAIQNYADRDRPLNLNFDAQILKGETIDWRAEIKSDVAGYVFDYKRYLKFVDVMTMDDLEEYMYRCFALDEDAIDFIVLDAVSKLPECSVPYRYSNMVRQHGRQSS